jgi:pSer/pThr/pTyr-binding forkhead associated (FHA) protein
MALTVLIRSGEAEDPAQITFDAPRVVLGRGQSCDVRLPDPSVSLRHASIRQRGSDYVLVDEGSTNGTFVGPVRLSPQAPRVLRATDVVRLGRIWLEVRIEQALPTVNPQASTREIALALVAGAFRAQGQPLAPRVLVTSSPDEGRDLFITDFERAYVVGRAPDADLTLSDNDASRRHVEIRRRGQELLLRDLGSKNGSELAGARLVPEKDTPWPAGATLRIGGTVLALEDPVLAALEGLEKEADEAMPPDESVDPPASVSDGQLPPRPAGASAGPLVDLPERRPAPEPARQGGLRLADVLIGGLAIVVLGLSLLGLAWVLRSN